MTILIKKDFDAEADRHGGRSMWRNARRRWPCDWAGFVYKPRNTKDCWKILEEARKYSPLEPSEETWPCWHLDFGFLASRTMRQQIAIVLRPPVNGRYFVTVVLRHWYRIIFVITGVRIVVLGKIFQSPLDSKEIKPVSPKGNQPWIFIGRTDAKAKAPILWPPEVKS